MCCNRLSLKLFGYVLVNKEAAQAGFAAARGLWPGVGYARLPSMGSLWLNLKLRGYALRIKWMWLHCTDNAELRFVPM